MAIAFALYAALHSTSPQQCLMSLRSHALAAAATVNVISLAATDSPTELNKVNDPTKTPIAVTGRHIKQPLQSFCLEVCGEDHASQTLGLTPFCMASSTQHPHDSSDDNDSEYGDSDSDDSMSSQTQSIMSREAREQKPSEKNLERKGTKFTVSHETMERPFQGQLFYHTNIFRLLSPQVTHKTTSMTLRCQYQPNTVKPSIRRIWSPAPCTEKYASRVIRDSQENCL